LKLDGYDRRMVEMVVNWAPYGGPPDEEVWVEFGIPRDLLIERVTAIVGACLKDYVPEGDRRLLLVAHHETRGERGRRRT
jgi:hypothetical protein